MSRLIVVCLLGTLAGAAAAAEQTASGFTFKEQGE
jgi:hypothetical protein